MIEIYSCATCKYYVPDDFTDGIGGCEKLDDCIILLQESCCDNYEARDDYEENDDDY